MQRWEIELADRLDVRRLRYFLAVIDSGSVRGAANALDMDASAVSRAISLLEKDCGVPLLERRGRGVAPTDAGVLMAGHLRREHVEKQNLLAQLDSIRKVESGHVGIATGEGFVDLLMRRSLARFMREHPNITVDLDIGSTDEIAERVIGGHSHIGVLFRPPKDKRLRSHYSNPQPIWAWMLRSHPLANIGRPLKLEDLQPFAGATLHRSFGVRQHIEAAEVSEGVRLNVSFTTASFDAVAHFVVAGLGYALVSHLALAPWDAAKVVGLPMKNVLLHGGRSHVVTAQGRQLPPAAAKVLRGIVRDLKKAAS